LANNVIKLNCTTPETYRKLLQYFKENDIFYHTYQLKEERAYRVVIKYLHHSKIFYEIRQELSYLGHKVRSIVNARHRITKDPLNLLFVDLEPAANNKDIYNITALQNKIIQVEPSRANKHNIIQCMRCQQYDHTKTYCNKPFVCVKYGGPHNSKECTERKDTPTKCALCGGCHPANYKRCEHYHNLLKGTNPHRHPPMRASSIPPNIQTNTITHHNNPQKQRRYADVTKNHEHQVEDAATTLKKFLEEF